MTIIKSKSKYKPHIGDYFSIELQGRYAVGRVIDFADKDHILAWQFKGFYLIYLINKIFSHDDISKKLYLGDQPILPPHWTGTTGWDKSIFSTLESKSLEISEKPSGFCYKSALGEIYYDEFGHRILAPTAICGNWGVANYTVTIRMAEEISEE
jgi:hypothetical protein